MEKTGDVGYEKHRKYYDKKDASTMVCSGGDRGQADVCTPFLERV